MTTTRRMWAFSVAAMCAAALSAGCEKTFWVHRYPSFYTPELKTVAVTPFTNKTDRRGAGADVSRQLAMALRSNGTYQVVGPSELRSDLEAKGVKDATAVTREQLPKEIARLQLADAYVTGTVLQDTAHMTTHTYWEYYYIDGQAVRPEDLFFDRDDRGGHGEGHEGGEFHEHHGGGHYEWGGGWGWGYPYGWGYWGPPGWYGWGPPYLGVNYTDYVTRAVVSVEVSMVRVSDGKVLYSTPTPLHSVARVEQEWSVPAGTVRGEAVANVARMIVGKIAVVPVKLKVSPAKALRTASGKTATRWNVTDTFPASAETMYAVLALPAAADRNKFGLTISPKGKRENVLAKQEFDYSAAVASDGVQFSPAKIAAAGGGPGEYSVNFYAEGGYVMSHDFRIK